jgi:two-component system sensor histidine kinase YesM
MEDNIVAMLDSFKSKGNNDPFLYKAPGGYVLNGTSDVNMAKEIVQAYELEANTPRNSHKIVTLHNKKYLVYFFNSSKINWTLVDYVPFEDILAPVTKSRSLFYITVGLLVLVGAGAVFLMYVHVQVPIKLLTASVSKLKMGVFSSRVQSNPNREFQALFVQFNEMAGRIQYLVEKVYLEEIRAKEAVMKQLQSQINPHFLYNSLAYVVSMAKLNRPQPIVSMAYSLADYYRYTTRNDSIETTLQEELAFVASYVGIMNHQLGKIRFELEVPASMNRILIPRLLIQPIVENAIVHGLEEQPNGGTIRITGSEEQEAYEITIEDDGVGLPNSDLDRLNEKLNYAVTDGESFGLWNVNQRLRYQFGKSSGVTVKRSASGGLKVVLRWYHNGSSEQGGNDVLDSNC